MATRTAVIHTGSGHPRHGGFTDPTGVRSLWLSEGAGQVWFEIDPRTKRPALAWAPFSIRSILLDGLIMSILKLGRADFDPAIPDDLKEQVSGNRIDLRAKLTVSDHSRLVAATSETAETTGRRFCVCAFEDSAILHQEDALRTLPLEIEYLRPAGVREYSPWLERVRKTGVFATAA